MDELDLPSLDSQSYQPLRKQVYEALREAILTGRLKQGAKITEMEIADKLNVSRTPVREAIRMLELEELVILVPQQGVFVAGIKSIKEINDIFQVRSELEGLAAFLTAQKITEEQILRMNNCMEGIKKCVQQNDLENCIEYDISFHQVIYEASENKWLQKLLDSLFEQITRFRSRSLGQKGRMKAALKEHNELAQALSGGKPEKAKKMAKQHIEKARKSVVKVFQTSYEKD